MGAIFCFKFLYVGILQVTRIPGFKTLFLALECGQGLERSRICIKEVPARLFSEALAVPWLRGCGGQAGGQVWKPELPWGLPTRAY